MPSVIMGRVQRRHGTDPLELRPFRDDVSELAGHEAFAVTSGGHTWIASDLRFDVTGDYLTGLMGFASCEVLFKPDTEQFSWLKAQVQEDFGGTPQTIVPFAVDVREQRPRPGVWQRQSNVKCMKLDWPPSGAVRRHGGQLRGRLNRTCPDYASRDPHA